METFQRLAFIREVAVSVAVMTGSACTMVLAYGYGLGRISMPGPGGFPFVLSVGMFLSSGVVLIGQLSNLVQMRRAGALPEENAPGETAGAITKGSQAAFLVLILITWTMLMQWIGFVGASLIGVTAVIWLNGQRSLARAVVFVAILTGGCYLLFAGLLGLPL